MSETDQLKKRIDGSGNRGVLTAHIRDDYQPAGDMMIKSLLASGEYVSRRTPANSYDSTWKVFKKGNEPY